jgi:3-oxoacyl-[acyl-carrier protein] reductase
MKIKDSVALVTGGAAGIGEVTAKALAAAGAKVAICDCVQDEIKRVVTEIKAADGEAIGLHGNVTSEEDQARFVSETINAFGKLNIMVPFAGIIRDSTVVVTDKETGKVSRKMTLDQWKSVIDVNLTGTFLSIRESVEAMVNGGWDGIVFTISSIGKEGQVGQINYSSTKIAVAYMPKILIGEFMIRKIRNVRAIGIAPGFIATSILKGMNQDALAEILKDVHLGRLIEPEEIAKLVIFCIENDAINGTTIEMTGGLCYNKARAK